MVAVARAISAIAYVRAGFGLAGLAESGFTYRSVVQEFGFFAEAFGFFGNAFFKGNGLLKSSARLHGHYLGS
ncbi:hypothetical protein ABIB95_004809 [Bradyrhizobium sp. LA2.1]